MLLWVCQDRGWRGWRLTAEQPRSRMYTQEVMSCLNLEVQILDSPQVSCALRLQDWASEVVLHSAPNSRALGAVCDL